MQNLVELLFRDCPELKFLPDGIEHLAALEKLVLQDTLEELIEKLRQKRDSDECSQDVMKINHIRNVTVVLSHKGLVERIRKCEIIGGRCAFSSERNLAFCMPGGSRIKVIAATSSVAAFVVLLLTVATVLYLSLKTRYNAEIHLKVEMFLKTYGTSKPTRIYFLVDPLGDALVEIPKVPLCPYRPRRARSPPVSFPSLPPSQRRPPRRRRASSDALLEGVGHLPARPLGDPCRA
ncbi:hypothetical protein ZWY2020_055112 [Hordeum vulgare]|nr:hypothetical protein ZWY2020_055112 [Hordeum vulgare]